MEQDDHKEISFSVRIAPIDLEFAEKLGKELSEFPQGKRMMRDSSGYNLAIDIEEGSDLDHLFEVLDREVPKDKIDIFISLVPERDSVIKEIPHHIIRIIAHFQCTTFVSFTAGY